LKICISGPIFVKLEDNSAERKKFHHFGDLFYNMKGFENVSSYITSAGTCSGDSGGPAYTKEGSKFIVTGICTYNLLSWSDYKLSSYGCVIP
jgi:secreted trypsin-like serine protease